MQRDRQPDTRLELLIEQGRKRVDLMKIPAKVKGEEIKNAKEASHVIYIYEEVLMPLLNRFQNILKSEFGVICKEAD